MRIDGKRQTFILALVTTLLWLTPFVPPAIASELGLKVEKPALAEGEEEVVNQRDTQTDAEDRGDAEPEKGDVPESESAEVTLVDEESTSVTVVDTEPDDLLVEGDQSALGVDGGIVIQDTNDLPSESVVTVESPDQVLDAQSETLAQKPPFVSVLTQQQNRGWSDTWTTSGAVAGITNKSLRLEAFCLVVNDQGALRGGIKYRSHVQTQGWQGWKKNGAVSGTIGKSRRIEAMQVCITGGLAKRYDVYYRVHVQDLGWMAWACNGQTAGTAGMGLRIEALQVVLVAKEGGELPLPISQQTESFLGTEEVKVAAHVQKLGWCNAVGNGEVAGTTGRGLRVEALRATLAGARVPGGVQVAIYQQGTGWKDWTPNGGVAGSVGQSLRLEALKMELVGDAADAYDLYYRVHVQGIGWLAWAKNGQIAGTEGLWLRIEAIQTRLVQKGAKAPSNKQANWELPAFKKLNVRYATMVQGAWQDDVKGGATSGSTGQSQNVEALRVSLTGNDAALAGGVEYSLHERGGDWTSWASNGGIVTSGAGKRAEAVRIRLTGVAASVYDVWYRAHAQSFGWMGWTRNGQASGTLGLARRLEAVQIKLVPKQRNKAPGPTEGSLRDVTMRMALDAAVSSRSVTAFGGYAMSSGVASKLKNAVNGIRNRGYDVGFIMMDLGTHKGVSYNCDALFYGASSIKAPYIASVVNKYPGAIVSYAYDITETLFYSWDYNYKQVLYAYGKAPMRTWCAESGARASIAESLPWANYSARDLAKMWGRTYQLYQTSSAGEKLGTWCERPNVSTIHATLGGMYRTRSKGGWIDAGGSRNPNINGGGPQYCVADDGGIVYARNGTYVVAIMSSTPADHDMLNELTAAIDTAHSEM